MADKEFSHSSVVAATASAIGLMAGASVIVHGSFGVFLVPLTKEFGWGRAEISIALSFWSWMQAFLIPIAGRLMDRYGVRFITLWGLILLAGALVALAAQNGSIYMLYGIYAVIGVCSSMGGYVGNAKLVSGWFHNRRGLVLALVAMGTGLAGSLLPQWLQLSIGHLGWRSAYLIVAVYVLVLAIPVFLFLREAPAIAAARLRHATNRAPTDASGMTVSAARRTLPFWLCMAALALNTVLLGLNLHMVPLLTDRGLSSEAAVTVLSAQVIGSTFIYLVVGYLLDRVNTPKLAVFFSICGLAGLLLLHFGTGFSTMMVAGVLIGVGMTGDSSAIPYFLTRFFGLRAFASIYGLMWGVAAVANGIQPVLLGASFDSTGSYNWGLVYCEASVFAAMLCFLFMPGYRYPARLPEHDAADEVLAAVAGEAKA